MAKCTICEKAARFGNSVSHSHRRSDRVWKANIRSIKIKTESDMQKMYICTSCFRSNLVERA